MFEANEKDYYSEGVTLKESKGNSGVANVEG